MTVDGFKQSNDHNLYLY